MAVKLMVDVLYADWTRGTTGTMSVTLINIFEVPAGDEDEFIAAWEKTRDYLKTFPAHIETALHQSLHHDRFRFVNIAHWRSDPIPRIAR